MDTENLDVGTTEMYETQMTQTIDVALLINELDLQLFDKH
jgi:hypothetical protein